MRRDDASLHGASPRDENINHFLELSRPSSLEHFNLTNLAAHQRSECMDSVSERF